MKPKHQRLIFITVSMVFLLVASLITMRAFRDNLVFFYSPSELQARNVTSGTLIRIGGLVESASIKKTKSGTLFKVGDGIATISVQYSGILPPLFREGQGIVAEGQLETEGVFVATRVLTKHDENYMPREVVDALKKSGRWQESGKSQ